jgi:hypothetical protein
MTILMLMTMMIDDVMTQHNTDGRNPASLRKKGVQVDRSETAEKATTACDHMVA